MINNYHILTMTSDNINRLIEDTINQYANIIYHLYR